MNACAENACAENAGTEDAGAEDTGAANAAQMMRAQRTRAQAQRRREQEADGDPLSLLELQGWKVPFPQHFPWERTVDRMVISIVVSSIGTLRLSSCAGIVASRRARAPTATSQTLRACRTVRGVYL